MKNTRYVQHISGQGEKWKVEEQAECWKVTRDGRLDFYLPKSEYHECAPPEVWRDVTPYLEVEEDGSEAAEPNEKVWAVQCLSNKYRLKKVRGMGKPAAIPCEWAFIIEKRES